MICMKLDKNNLSILFNMHYSTFLANEAADSHSLNETLTIECILVWTRKKKADVKCKSEIWYLDANYNLVFKIPVYHSIYAVHKNSGSEAQFQIALYRAIITLTFSWTGVHAQSIHIYLTSTKVTIMVYWSQIDKKPYNLETLITSVLSTYRK